MTQKWNLQDIRPVQPKKVRTPSISSDRPLGKSPALEAPNLSHENADMGSSLVIRDGNKEKKNNYFLLSFAAVLIIGGIFGLSLLVSKTTLTVYPEFSEPNVNAEFVAYPEQRDGQLSYEIMTITESGEKQVKATGQEEVKEQAKGYIEIVKTTTGAERLIKNTRFRTKDGLIFRIQESVIVPGAVKDASGSLIPGTIRAEVFADEVGEKYNLPAGERFDIPGFKENKLDDLYNSIYAENRDSIGGGFEGPRFTINPEVLATSEQELQIELRNKLLERINVEKPADFAAFPGAIAITYNSLPPVKYGEDLVTLRIEAVLQQPLFKQADFASYVAEATITSYVGEAVRISNLSDLTFSFKDASQSSSNLANATAINFVIIGKPKIVWEFDAEQLRNDLAGKSLTAITTILTGHTGIRSAEISGKPFWKRAFPEEPGDIVVTEVVGDKLSE